MGLASIGRRVAAIYSQSLVKTLIEIRSEGLGSAKHAHEDPDIFTCQLMLSFEADE